MIMFSDTVVIVCSICVTCLLGFVLVCATGYIVYVERERLRQEGLLQRARLRAAPDASNQSELAQILSAIMPLLGEPGIPGLIQSFLSGRAPPGPPPMTGQTELLDDR